MDRRTFFKLTGLAGATAAAAGCAENKDSLKLIYSQVVPEEIVPLGQEAWFATLCQECRAGCSLLVRIVEGRAKKIEGNPLFPVNRGKTCARGQAALQGLYNPDRWKSPQRRGPEGSLQPIEWEDALAEAAGSLERLRENGQKLLLVTPPVTGHLHLMFHHFSEAFASADWVRWAPFEDTVLRRAVRDNLGLNRLPTYRIEDADFLLTFGCDFLATEMSPVHLANQYGRFRQGDPRAGLRGRRLRGVWYHFEPRLSVTASNADRWIPVEPGYEGMVALALARLLVEQARLSLTAAERRRWLQAVAVVSVEEAERHIDAPRGTLEELVDRLMQVERPLVIGGGTAAATDNGLVNLWAIQALQTLLGDTDEGGPVRTNPPSPLKALEAFQEAGDGTELRDAASGFQRLEEIGRQTLAAGDPPYGAVLVWGVDLLHTLPAGSAFRKAFERIPVRISATPYPDDTSQKATLVLPTSTPLESWGDGVPDPGPGLSAWALAQPTVPPLYGTRAPGDLLLDLARRLGGGVAEALPWKDTAQALDDSLFQFYDRYATEIGGAPYEEFFNRIVAQGGWFQSHESNGFVPLSEQTARVSKSFPLSAPGQIEPSFEGEADSFPFYLLPYPSLALLAGDGANRPWLQELGDPLTTVAWGTWAEVNPRTASSLGLQDGDEVRLETPFGSVMLPVYIYPGVRPDTVAVPAGGGHKKFGRYAEGRGANVMDLLPATMEDRTGAFAWISTRVRVTPTGRKGEMVRFEGSGKWVERSEMPV
jgi:anaerobic selenocysteine-containing dehydrogenase